MKRYTSFLHFILLQVVIMMTSCSSDDTYTDNLTTKPGAAKPLCISVNRTDFLSDSKTQKHAQRMMMLLQPVLRMMTGLAL